MAASAQAQTAQGAPRAATLTGADEGLVKAQLGVPDIARAEGQGALWTYRFPRCALLVFFRMSGRTLRVTGASASDRRTGGSVDLDQCLAHGAETAHARDLGQDAIDALLAPPEPGR
jgi:hypothetical protein